MTRNVAHVTPPRPRRPWHRRLPLVLVVVVGLCASVGASPAAAGPGDPVYTERTAGVQVSGTYQPVVGNFAGDALDDILWYAPGATMEQLWVAVGDGTFTKTPLSRGVSGTYQPLVGDFAGSSDYDDLFWYAPGRGADSLWITDADGRATFTSVPKTVNGTYVPLVLTDSDNTNDNDDIVWWGLGTAPDATWAFSGTTGTVTTRAISIGYTASVIERVGDFDGNGFADIMWYRPGSASDSFWLGDGFGGFTTQSFAVNGTYQPVVGDFDRFAAGGTSDDILWHRNGVSHHPVWLSPAGARTTHTLPAPPNGAPLVLDYGNSGSLVHMWTGGGSDQIWALGDHPGFPTNNTSPGVDYTPIIGQFAFPASIFWYRSGAAVDRSFVFNART